jgi:glycosyltransferase involved in cell wall biosynthesis
MIAPVPFFAPRGTPISVLGRLKTLASLGHEVDLITYPKGEDVVISGVKLYRTRDFRFIKEIPVGPSWVKVFLDFFVVFKSVRMLIGNSYDLIHTHEEGSIFGTVLAKLFKLPHLYDFHSSIPQALGNFGYDKFPLLIGFFEWLERIIISPELANYVRKIDKRIPIVTIEDTFEAFDAKSVSMESTKKLREEYSLSDGTKIILYVGTFEQYQGLDLLIDSLEIVSKHIDAVKFLLVGGTTTQIEYFQKKTGNKGLSSFFLFTGIRPPEEIPMFINIANVLVSTRIKGWNPPSKIFSYLHSGKPIVATNHISHTQVLSPEIAHLVESNPEEIAKGIIHMLENPDVGEAIGARARQFYEKNYRYENFVESTNKILNLTVK